MLEQKSGYLGACAIAQSNPDDFGWEAISGQQIIKICIFADDAKPSLVGKLPNINIGCCIQADAGYVNSMRIELSQAHDQTRR